MNHVGDGHPQGGGWRAGFGRQELLVVTLALTLNLAGNGRISLWDRDEPRYAGCTREMRVSGDWIHPTFNAEPRYHKPVLIYWLMLAGTALGGENPFGARLVSGLAGAATCLLVLVWGRRLLGPRGGLLAALILATAPIMVAESKLATTDATLTFFVVACQFALWELCQRQSALAAATFWVLLALAVLTKAPAAPVLITAMGLVSWWWGGPTVCWRRLHWSWGPALAVLIAAPWFVAIHIRSQGQYYDVAVGYHIIRRATNGIEEHGGFLGYYLITALLTFFPWSAMLPAAVCAAWLRRRSEPLFGFLLGWVIGPLVLLECVRTKLIHYYLPAFPGCALLLGWWLDAVLRADVGIRRWRLGRLALALLGAIGLGTAGTLIGTGLFISLPVRWALLGEGLILGTGSLIAWRLFRTERTEQAVRGLMATMALVALLAGAWLLPGVEPYRISGLVGRKLAAYEKTEGTPAVLCTYQLPNVVYALGHPAPIVESHAEVKSLLERRARFLTALLPAELESLSANPAFRVELLETVRGFNLDKGRQETLHIVTIHSGERRLSGPVGSSQTR